MANVEFTTEELAAEEWRPVIGWEGRYEVSSLGRVKSLFAHGKPKGGELILRASATRKRDYLHVHLGHGHGSTAQVHVLVAQAFVGPKPDPKAEVNHKDGVKTNCRFGNLEWTTRLGNTAHAYATGLITPASGERHWSRRRPERVPSGDVHWSRARPILVARGTKLPHAKLNETTVREILLRLAAGESQASIARAFGVIQQSVSQIARGITWRHVTRHEPPKFVA